MMYDKLISMIFSLKLYFNIFSVNEKYIISSMIKSLKYCETAIEYHLKHKDRKDFFGYSYNHGVCFNLYSCLKNFLGTTLYHEKYEFIDQLILKMHLNYSNFSGDHNYPINHEMGCKNFYHTVDRYSVESSAIRLQFIKECIEYLDNITNA